MINLTIPATILILGIIFLLGVMFGIWLIWVKIFK